MSLGITLAVLGGMPRDSFASGMSFLRFRNVFAGAVVLGNVFDVLGYVFGDVRGKSSK